MKIRWKTLLICVAIPLIVGGLSALISGDAMATFSALEKPPLSPPALLFPVVWTVLYILMGIASYLIVVSDAPPAEKKHALTVYGAQLAVNFFWSILFFNLELYLFSFFWLVLLWMLIAITLQRFHHIDRTAGYLLIPYLVWVTFAGYLNLGIYLLN